jgi:hypothetical protein
MHLKSVNKRIALLLALATFDLGVFGLPAAAAKYSVICVAPGALACRAACGSNIHTVVCYAVVQNGRCLKYCGRPR